MGELSSPAKVKEILSRYHFRTKKTLGQNFLIDGNIIEKIVQTAGVSDNDMVVEIGPGIGVLTSTLAQKAQRVLAVEIDKKLQPILEETLAPYDNVDVVFADAMETNFDRLVYNKSSGRFGAGADSYKLVANLPYYITTPLIMHMLTNKFNLNTLVIMVQKEVGMRMAASPGSKDYGALTVAVQYYTDAEIAFKVPKTVFYPRPEVDSVVVKLRTRRTPPVQVKDENLLFQVVRAAFGKRRKTLLNALAGSGIDLNKKQWTDLLKGLEIDPKRRGETLSMKEFASIANELYNTITA
ncbi:16S rRNA (adenine1518-N6/adenine1519-N6)-dimethyltransferase [Desulfohalotomaculum tongense]|uniref:16S rRNA (adenine(1518)-N(6)/adenine(1519)-N(6))- dimethyltransferase RsmA n=1 Tax=Desulforadius tongensis TaxID=1216062 RepID=UPI001959FAAB|nr:16S rRNA (adenine1518-N6/adenine1519-N6)-dimethyltransferase [Desulforadius tongensis]